MTSQAEIGNLRVRLGIDSAEFASGVRGVQGQLASLSSSLKTFATGAVAIGVFREAVATLHDVADIGDVADAIGITAEQLQVYQKMALAANASTETMAKGLQTLAEQSTDAKSKLSELFSANGLLMSGKSMNQIILDFMTLLQNAKSPAEQLAMATGVLGDKVGRQLVEALRGGAEGWNQAFNSMAKDGWYLSDEQTKAAQEIETKYNQVIANLTSAWQSFVVTVAQGLSSAFGGDSNYNPEFLPAGRAGYVKNPNYKAPGTAVSAGKGDLQNNVNLKSGGTLNRQTANPFSGIDVPKLTAASSAANDAADALQRMKDEGAALFEQTRTPLEQYQEGMKHLDELLKSGAIDQDTYARAAKQLGEQFSETAPAVNELTDTFEQLGQSIEYSLSNALAGLASGAMSAKEAFTEMAQSMSQQLAQLAAQLLTSQIFKLLSMIGGSLSPIQGGGFLSSLLGSLAGARAAGGPVAAGSSYLVGENGPELFRPNTSGSIVPNNALRGGSSQMNVTVINNSASSVSTRKNQRGDLEVMIEDMLADKLARGGNKVDSALQRGYGLKRAGR